jgi:hypothetical protein
MSIRQRAADWRYYCAKRTRESIVQGLILPTLAACGRAVIKTSFSLAAKTVELGSSIKIDPIG